MENGNWMGMDMSIQDKTLQDTTGIQNDTLRFGTRVGKNEVQNVYQVSGHHQLFPMNRLGLRHNSQGMDPKNPIFFGDQSTIIPNEESIMN